jgi:hypothetical protein
MSPSPRCLHYTDLLIDNHWAALESISPGNEEIVASLLAGAICHAEHLIKIECHSNFQAELITVTVEALQEYKSQEWAVMPLTLKNMLAMAAVIRYRECVITALGGNQTPCTVSAIKTSTNLSESPDSCGIPRISKMISKIREILKTMVSLLGISTISKDLK